LLRSELPSKQGGCEDHISVSTLLFYKKSSIKSTMSYIATTATSSMDNNMNELLAMGYSSTQAELALEVTQGDLGQAVSFLLLGDSTRMGFCAIEEGDSDDNECQKKPAAGVAASVAAATGVGVAAAAAAAPTNIGNDDVNDDDDGKPKAEDTSSESVRALLQMGYNVKDSKAALSACGGDVYQAIEYLLTRSLAAIPASSVPDDVAAVPTATTPVPAVAQLPSAAVAKWAMDGDDDDDDDDDDDHGNKKVRAAKKQTTILKTKSSKGDAGGDEDAALAYALQQQEEINMQQERERKLKSSSAEEDERLAMALQHEQEHPMTRQPLQPPGGATAGLLSRKNKDDPDEDELLALALHHQQQEETLLQKIRLEETRHNKVSPRTQLGGVGSKSHDSGDPDEDELLAIALHHEQQEQQHKPPCKPGAISHYPDEDELLAMSLHQEQEKERQRQIQYLLQQQLQAQQLQGSRLHSSNTEDEMLAMALQRQEQYSHNQHAQEEQRRQAELMLAAARESLAQSQEGYSQHRHHQNHHPHYNRPLLRRGSSDNTSSQQQHYQHPRASPHAIPQQAEQQRSRSTPDFDFGLSDEYDPYSDAASVSYSSARRPPPPVLLQQQQFRRDHQLLTQTRREQGSHNLAEQQQQQYQQQQQNQQQQQYQRPPAPPLSNTAAAILPTASPWHGGQRNGQSSLLDSSNHTNRNDNQLSSPVMREDDPFGFNALGTVAMPGDPSYTSPVPTAGRGKNDKSGAGRKLGFGGLVGGPGLFGGSNHTTGLLGGSTQNSGLVGGSTHHSDGYTGPGGSNIGGNRLASPITMGRMLTKGAGAVVGGAAKVAGAAGAGAAMVAGGAASAVVGGAAKVAGAAGAGAAMVAGGATAMVGAASHAAVINPNVPRMVVTNVSILNVVINDSTRDAVSVFCAVMAASKFYQGGKVNSDFLNSIVDEGISLCARVDEEHNATGPSHAVSSNINNNARWATHESWSVLRVLVTTGSDLGIAAAEMDENPKQGFFLESDLEHPFGVRKVLAKCRNEQRGTEWQIIILETTSSSGRDCVTICLPPKGSTNKFWCLDVQPRCCFRAPPGAYARAHSNMMQLVESLEGILKSIMVADGAGGGGNNHMRPPKQFNAFGMGEHPDGEHEPFSLYVLRKVF
jgi:Holliday junction resolvasome RuvABC DNA-binding subunit